MSLERHFSVSVPPEHFTIRERNSSTTWRLLPPGSHLPFSQARTVPSSTESLCAMRLRDGPHTEPPLCKKPLSERLRGRKRVIAEELYNPRKVPDGWDCLFILPVADRPVVHRQTQRNLLLEEPQIEPPLLQVVAYRPKSLRIRRWFYCFQRYFAKWQERNTTLGLQGREAIVGGCRG